METTECGDMFTQLATDTSHLDTVRALHQTVVALRIALDKSRSELEALRVKVQTDVTYTDTIEKLSLENHVLRQRILNVGDVSECVVKALEFHKKQNPVDPSTKHMESTSQGKEEKQVSEVPQSGTILSLKTENGSSDAVLEGGVVSDSGLKSVEMESEQDKKKQDETKPEENEDTKQAEANFCPTSDTLTMLSEKSGKTEKQEYADPTIDTLSQDGGKASCEKIQTEQSSPPGSRNDRESDNESEELDDIELIFTTEETKELGVLQEDLVPITEGESWQQDEVIVKFNEVDRFEDSSKNTKLVDGESVEDKTVTKVSDMTNAWTQSVPIETDISKCGVVDEVDHRSRASRRNTLPNPLICQPVLWDPSSGARSHVVPTNGDRGIAVKFVGGGIRECGQSPVRPILTEKNTVKRESEAQTDITALPSQWRSESYLAHKVSHNFTTLPSKFTLPTRQPPAKYSLRLSEKTREARRTLLSDINFTSMVPELSRSADHLCPEDALAVVGSGLCRNYPHAHAYMKNVNGGHASHTGSGIVSPGFGMDVRSPSCDCSRADSVGYGSSLGRLGRGPRYRGSLTSLTPQTSLEYPDSKRRYSWRPSPEVYGSTTLPQKPSWGSVPTSPTHCRWARGSPFTPSYATPQSEADLYTPSYWGMFHDVQYDSSAKWNKVHSSKGRIRNKVTFFDSPLQRRTGPGQSLPDLRADLGAESGDSTDSLIDEAEEYLRRSIDSTLTHTDWARVGKRRQTRRMSDPDPIRELTPPKSARPFLPKTARELRLDYLVKVITSEGRVAVGRVRYVGPTPAGPEPYVGVELPGTIGNCDGTFAGRRYFDCDADKAVFVPFKKVVMAWSI